MLGHDAVTAFTSGTEQLEIRDPDWEEDTGAEDGGADIFGAEKMVSTKADPEGQLLPFPSAFSSDHFETLDRDHQTILTKLKTNELAIRQGHAEDLLEFIRSAIVQLSWVYKNEVRSTTGYHATRATTRVGMLASAIRLHRQSFQANRAIMVKLSSESLVAQTFPPLTVSDTNTSIPIVTPNARGGSSHWMSWIWTISRVNRDAVQTGGTANAANAGADSLSTGAADSCDVSPAEHLEDCE